MNAPVPLSVVVATTQPWPEIRECLTRLRPQIAASDTELIVADGNAAPATGLPPAECQNVRRLSYPGASVFALRAAGLAAARGAIVAFTEDHCRPQPNWCARVIASHEAHPDADAVGGAILNGSTTRLIDWANFALTFAPFVPPMTATAAGRAPAIANASYKRRVLTDAPTTPGWLEFTLNERLLASGRIAFDDSLVVEHVQAHGFRGTFAAHFHNGRATTGLVADGFDGTVRRQRARQSIALLPGLLRDTITALGASGTLTGWQRACIPLVAGLVVCHGIGTIVGLVAGPGTSPARLR